MVVVPITSERLGNTRSLRIYLPRGYHDAANAQQRYPVLIMNDGFAVFSARSWNAPARVDSAIAAGFVAPFILVGIDNAASIPGTTNPGQARTNEFLPYPDRLEPAVPNPRGSTYAEFVVHEVMPLLGQRFRASNDRSDIGIGGSSYGGTAALYTYLRFPDRFGKLLIESTLLSMFEGRLVDQMKAASILPDRLYFGVGTKETEDAVIVAQAASSGDAFVQFATERLGNRFWFNRVEGGTHTSAAWGARFPAALHFLFPAN